MRLLAQVVGEFHESKCREALMRRNAYLQAVHETGARLTHDIKNLLQSLFALTSAAPAPGEAQERYTQLLQRQLPQITRRLQSTLEQLRSPHVEVKEVPKAALAWWREAEARAASPHVSLEASFDGAAMVPGSAFDAFLENCLENARRKRETQPALRVAIRLEVGRGSARLEVSDDGDAIPEPIAKRLFAEPVPHEGDEAMGIGLYQVGRLAAQSGYRAALTANEPGRVVFRLAPD